MVMCPISPAMSDLRRYTRPASTIPPPIPVPIVSPTTWLAPRAAPRHHSPKLAQLASVSSVAGNPRAPAHRDRGGKLAPAKVGGAEEHPSELPSQLNAGLRPLADEKATR